MLGTCWLCNKWMGEGNVYWFQFDKFVNFFLFQMRKILNIKVIPREPMSGQNMERDMCIKYVS